METWEILQQELRSYQHKNKLFPASHNSENKLMRDLFWVRDNYYAYLAVDKKTQKEMYNSFQKIFDKIRGQGKFNLSNFNPENEWSFIHPLYTKGLNEIDQNWSYVQNDSAGNLLEIFSREKDKERSKILIEYLKTIKYFDCKDYGFWEEGPRELRSSSLGACTRGIEAYLENIEETPSISRLAGHGEVSIYAQLPNETTSRKSDLALLSLIYPQQMITGEYKKQIITNIKENLLGDHGIKRYRGDQWDGMGWTLGEGNEMEWSIGLPWLYLATNEKEHLYKSREVIKEFGFTEGVANGEANCTQLIWYLAMQTLAEKRASISGH